jgi:hypothetical protein|tara:strand:+ start:512 stop:652 length:141 start_codon:yes stop_codon:yes gene_type:complete
VVVEVVQDLVNLVEPVEKVVVEKVVKVMTQAQLEQQIQVVAAVVAE